MTTSYFILSKNIDKPINDDNENNITFLKNKLIYLLPYNLIDYYISNGLYEKNIIEFCKNFKNDNKIFLDIGAHTGTYSISLHRYFKKVLAFEPHRKTFYALCGSVAMNDVSNIYCFNFGLGSENQRGLNELYITSHDGGSSTLHPKNNQNIIKKEEIIIKTLDELNISEKIGMIKIDVEENELEVLRGAVITIKNSDYPPILFESNYENKMLFEFVRETLGYEIFNIYNVNNMFFAQKKN
jgi:FkbM family methyltransferase